MLVAQVGIQTVGIWHVVGIFIAVMVGSTGISTVANAFFTWRYFSLFKKEMEKSIKEETISRKDDVKELHLRINTVKTQRERSEAEIKRKIEDFHDSSDHNYATLNDKVGKVAETVARIDERTNVAETVTQLIKVIKNEKD